MLKKYNYNHKTEQAKHSLNQSYVCGRVNIYRHIEKTKQVTTYTEDSNKESSEGDKKFGQRPKRFKPDSNRARIDRPVRNQKERIKRLAV